MKVNVDDIANRILQKDYPAEQMLSYDVPNVYTENGKYSSYKAVDYIHRWRNLAQDSNAAFNRAVDVLEEMVFNNDIYNIVECCRFLTENVDKVRDSNQLQNSIKYRNSRLKTKISTKINNKKDDVTSNILANINKLTSTLGQAGSKVAAVDTSTGDNSGETTQEAAIEALLNQCYKNIYSEANKAYQCDRILRNYEKINEQFDIDDLLQDISTEQDVYPAIMEIAYYVDHFNTPFRNKYNTALETAYYAFNSYNFGIPDNTIIEAVTDYYLVNGAVSELEVEDVRAIIDGNAVFSPKTFDDILDMNCLASSNTSIDKVDLSKFTDEYGTLEEHVALLEEDLKQTAKAAKEKIKQYSKASDEEKKTAEIEKMVTDFRDNCLKNKDKKNNIFDLKALVTKIFTKSPDQIVSEIPNLFGILRGGFIIGATAINPILGVLAVITNGIIKMTLSRKQAAKILTAYKNEIEAVNKKIDKVKSDKEKEKLKAYKDALKKDYEKIRQHEMNLYTDDENDERDAYSYDDDFDSDDIDLGDDFDIDFGDDEWDLDFDEATNLAAVEVISNLTTHIHEGIIDDNLDGMVCGNVFKMDNDTIDGLAQFIITVPDVLDKRLLSEAYKRHRDELREQDNPDYRRIDTLNEAIRIIENRVHMAAEPSIGLKGVIEYLYAIDEFVQQANNQYITEMNFVNTLKLAAKNLKANAIKLSDKEKKISSQIDVSVNNVAKSIETARLNNNREAIIKGRVIPSASQAIKLAITTGLVWAVNPAIAVIGAVGAFVCTKKSQDKERQLILDDIEVELKMCERYIHQYEEKNDLKKVREVEKIQRNLQRQQQRIKYKMNVEHSKRIPNATDTPQDVRDRYHVS